MLQPRIPRSFFQRPKRINARNTSSIHGLQAAFRDPSSPFYLAPGTHGPESPDSPPVQVQMTTLASEAVEALVDPLKEAEAIMTNAGFDPQSFWEQRIVWGDQDSFRHVNNVRYFRFFESARIKWMMKLGEELGGPSRAKAMIDGHGISLILKSIEVRYRRPVTYPDTLLIGYRVLPFGDAALPVFHVAGSAFSLSQKRMVADTKEALVWYDYDKLEKCHPDEKAKELLRSKMKQIEPQA